MQEVPISCGFLAFLAGAATLSCVRIVSDILLLFVNGSEALAVTGRDMNATRRSAKGGAQVWLSEARALLAEGYGGASGLAEKLLREAGTAGRLPWGYLRKNGDAADDDFWRCARIDFKENSAHVGITFFFVGPGVGRDDGLRSTEYLGIWVSRAHVLALLPEPTDASASVKWARATTRRLLAEGGIPEDAKKQKSKLARLLEAESQTAVKVGQLSRALKASYLENQLVPWGIWPLNSFK
jgi:hypothetical protein